MKKFNILILVSAFLFSCGNINAQAFKKGDLDLGIGIGLGGHYRTYAYSNLNSSQTPVIALNGEYCLFDKIGPGSIGVGGYFGFKSITNKGVYNEYIYPNYFQYTYKQVYTYYIIGIKGAFHYTPKNIEKLDLYGGLMIHFNINTYRETSDDPYFNASSYHRSKGESYPSTSEFVGAKYFFKPKFGAFVELGYGVSYATVGLNFKFAK